MNNLKKLALALNKLGLNKEANQILSLRKVAADPAANNKIRANILKMAPIFKNVSEILGEYLEYKKADPDDKMISEKDLRGISERIFRSLEKAMSLIETSEELTLDIGFVREDLLRRTRAFLSSIYRLTNNLYGLVGRKLYGESSPGIKKLQIFYWKNMMEKLSVRCTSFVESGRDDSIKHEERKDRQTFRFDPSEEITAAGLEETLPGSAGNHTAPEFQTSTEITIPTPFSGI